MKLHETSHWVDPSEYRGLLFFAQRFDELTFAYTLDSFRAPTTNAPHLVRECIQQLRLGQELGRSTKAVSHILDETRSKLKSNIIAAACTTLPTDRYFKFEVDDVGTAIKKLTILSRELSPLVYLSACATNLRSVIPTHRKSDIDQLASEYATSLLNVGFSAQHLNKTCHEVFFSKANTVESYKALDNFIAQLEPTRKKYCVYFDAFTKISEINPEVAKGFGVTEMKSLPKAVAAALVQCNFKLPKIENMIVAFEDIRAFDEYTALNLASARLHWLHDIYGLFRHRNNFEIGAEAIVCNAEKSKASLLRTDINQMHRISDNKPEQANKKLGHMLSELTLPSGSDKNRFFRVINFHGLSTRSASEENQLLNLWTALETMTSSHSSSSSIVDTVTREIIPIITLNYLHRLVRSVTLDLVRWDRRKLRGALNNCVDSTETNLIHKVFSLIAAEENSDQKEALLGSITDFELLRFRIFSLNKHLVSGKKILERLQRHEQLVTWQIHRIYRARNQIIHSSNIGSNTNSLIVSAHDYLDQVFENTAQLSSGARGFRTYQECFHYCSERVVEYKKAISRIQRTTVSDVPTILWQPMTPLSRGLLFNHDDQS